MDYIFASTLKHHHPKQPCIISYDIVCQWAIYLLTHLKTLPPHLRLVATLFFVWFVVPKLHLRAHTIICQRTYSLNYLPGSGRTDGEEVERLWANIGGVTTSTQEMGLGSRHDTLDDHFGHWNWQKLVCLGVIYLVLLMKIMVIIMFQAPCCFYAYAACFPSMSCKRCLSMSSQSNNRTTSSCGGQWLRLTSWITCNPIHMSYLSQVRVVSWCHIMWLMVPKVSPRLMFGCN
jgi:hypothetical protein